MLENVAPMRSSLTHLRDADGKRILSPGEARIAAYMMTLQEAGATFEQAIERCLMDGTTAQALRLIAADFDDASDDCVDAIAIRQGADGLDTLVARVTDLTASLNRASDACASVQRERDELREMLGEAVQVIRDWRDWLNCEEPERIPDAADHEAMILQGMAEFLARYEAWK